MTIRLYINTPHSYNFTYIYSYISTNIYIGIYLWNFGGEKVKSEGVSRNLFGIKILFEKDKCAYIDSELKEMRHFLVLNIDTNFLLLYSTAFHDVLYIKNFFGGKMRMICQEMFLRDLWMLEDNLLCICECGLYVAGRMGLFR